MGMEQSRQTSGARVASPLTALSKNKQGGYVKMKNYKEIRKGMIFDGDIIKIVDSVFDESIKSKCWPENFVNQIKFLKVDSITNNGTIRAHDKNRHFYLLSASEPKIIAAYTA